MTDLQIRIYCFESARQIEGPGANICKILMTAEMIFLHLTQERGLPTKH